jgi:hypothetical protein
MSTFTEAGPPDRIRQKLERSNVGFAKYSASARQQSEQE